MDFDKSLPLAEAAVDAENAGQDSSAKNCLNCDTPLTGKYCSQCGQKNLAKRQSLPDLLENFISSFWSFESKFMKTGVLLMFKPGCLAVDYNEGKRERYYHPARMYVFISFVYFLLLATLPDDDSGGGWNVRATDEDVVDSVKTDDVLFGKYKTQTQYDSAQSALEPSKRDGFWERQLRQRIFIPLNKKYDGRKDQFQADFSDNFFNNSPKVFFFLLPIFALLLKILYIRRDFYYSEHLVFSIYYYNFFFLAGSIYMLWDLLPYLNFVSWIAIIWIMLYLLFGMKTMYKQSWGKTILKYCTFVFVFSFCTLIGLAVNLALTLMFL